jgi:hypothetical protein
MVTELFMVDGETRAYCPDGDIRKRRKFYGKSTDTKPTEGVRNVDTFYEMDTGDLYLFDEDSGSWLKQ